MRKNLRTWGLAIAFGLCPTGCAQDTQELTILHFNDVYEFQPSTGSQVGGAARFKTLAKEYDAEKPLLLFSGDAIGGSQISLFEKGRPSIAILNSFGTDYAVIGNHEFDYGVDNAKQRFRESRFTWLNSNIVDATTKKPIAGEKEYALVEWNGIKVGLIGLVSDWSDRTHLGGNDEFEDDVTEGRRLARLLKSQGAQIVIALTHMFMSEDRELALAVPEIDLILGGHDHDPQEAVLNGTLIWKSGSDLSNLGLIRARLRPGAKPDFSAKNIPVTSQIAADADTQKLVASYVVQNETRTGQSLGESEVPLDTREVLVRQRESNFGNLVADAIRDHAQAELAITNGGGIRSNQVYPAGVITKKMVQAMLPFPNKVVTVLMTGKQIQQALEHGVSHVEDMSGQFLHVSGMRYAFYPDKPRGQRIGSILVGKSRIVPDKTYHVATTDFLSTGGDGYAFLKNLPRPSAQPDEDVLYDIVAAYIEKKGIISPLIEGRIAIID